MNRVRSKRVSRRDVLRGAGGIALSLPLLDSMRPASAQTAAPTRIVFEFKPNGDQVGRRFKSTGETDFEFDEFLEPLEPYREELLILNRLDKRIYELPVDQRSDNHQMGTAGLAPWPAGEGNYPVGGENRTMGAVLGPSADFEIGRRVTSQFPGVRQQHLIMRVGGLNNDNTSIVAHGGPVGEQNQLSPETDPKALYSRLFGAETSDDAQRAARLKQSMLDHVMEENARLTRQLGQADRQKLERYTEALRNVERSLYPPAQTDICQPNAPVLDVNVHSDAQHEVVGKAFQDLIALCFACDLTRVVNFAWAGGVSNRLYQNLGMTEGHHEMSHQSTEEAFVRIRAIHRHLWTLSTGLYDVLKDTPEGDGSLWDNTLIVHWNELGQGDLHSIDNILTIFAGGMAGRFQRGRYLDLQNQASFSDMLVNCFHYMGYEDIQEFGDPRLSHLQSPISGLRI